MRLTEIDLTEARPVEGYGPGFFRIDGKVIEGGMRVLPNAAPCVWHGYEDTEALISAANHMDVLLVGTGAEMAYLPAALRKTLDEAGIGIEQMSSPAACRSYNVLLSEGRRVGLAVLPV